jgi:hypothetical protein
LGVPFNGFARGQGSISQEENMKLFRQGDVLIREIEEVPAQAKAQKTVQGRVILAEGEVTGHHHILIDEGVELLTADAAERYLHVTAPVRLQHEEHATVTIPPGNYAVTIQREYHPEAIRNVVD